MSKPTTTTFSTYASPKEICKLLEINRSTLHRWTAEGKFPPAIQIGKVKRYRTADIEAFLNQKQTQEETNGN